MIELPDAHGSEEYVCAISAIFFAKNLHNQSMTNLTPPKVAMETHFGSHSLTREERIRRAAALSDEVKVTDLSSDSVGTESESDTEPTPG